ncbi:MAG: DNA gyrase inhibitor YacG [Gammaproteobacteria bacterium]|nr:DNA gyrase inhibitor YacG [Gammaproteobacteria bacterium]
MTETPSSGKCPTCQNSFEWDQASPWRPFCCERCRLIDLGEWLNEGHRIEGTEESSVPPVLDIDKH